MESCNSRLEPTVGSLRNLLTDLPDDTIVRLSVAGWDGDHPEKFSGPLARARLAPVPGCLILSDE